MLGDFNPAQSIPLSLVTERLAITGMLTTRARRLIDLANDPNVDYMLLEAASFEELGSRRLLAEAELAQIRLSDVLFLHARQPTGPGGGMRTPKQPIVATLLVPPFTVEGTIYLPFESDLRMALDAYGERFVPVTNAKYSAYSMAELPVTTDLLVVNRARAHIAIAPGVEWAGASGPAAAGPENPW